MKKYVATSGAQFPKKLAQRYGEYLHHILPERLGRSPTTDDIWKDAKENPDCPYHKGYFEWNPKKAAIAYLRVQARNLVNHIAEVTVIEGERKVCKAFFPIHERVGQPKRWVPMSDIRRDPLMIDQVIESARRELVGWSERFSSYQALKGAARLVERAVKIIRPKKEEKFAKRKRELVEV